MIVAGSCTIHHLLTMLHRVLQLRFQLLDTLHMLLALLRYVHAFRFQLVELLRRCLKFCRKAFFSEKSLYKAYVELGLLLVALLLQLCNTLLQLMHLLLVRLLHLAHIMRGRGFLKVKRLQ